MKTADRYRTFEEFWPYYVKEHQKKATRIFHFVGTSAAMACLAGGVITKRRWMVALAPIAGYGPAWVSHFFIEKNRPATFDYPVWSLRADFVMWWKMVRREMSDEVERVLADERARAEEQTEEQSAQPEAREPGHVSVQGEAVN